MKGGGDHNSWRRLAGGDCRLNSKTLFLHGLKSDSSKYSSCRGLYAGKKHLLLQKHVGTIAVMFGLMGCLFLLDSVVVSFFDFANLQHNTAYNSSSWIQVKHILLSSLFSNKYIHNMLGLLVDVSTVLW